MVSHVESPHASALAAKPARESFLPFHRPWIDDDDVNGVVAALRSGWLTMGPKTMEFEQAFAEHVGAKHAVAVNSATAGLHLALDAVGVGPGWEVITSVYTFTSTAAVAIHLGAWPVLVDVVPGTLTLDPSDVRRRLSARTRVIIPVHLAGVPADMDAITAIAAERRLVVVEDAAHALPARYKSRTIGTIGDMTVFSFYAGKNMTTGEGGMVTTSNDEYAERIRRRRLHGIGRDAWKRYTAEGSWYYEVEYPGFKYNPTDLNSALGLQQLRKLAAFHELRTHYAELYRRGLADLPEIRLPEVPPWAESAWHLFIVQLELERLTIGRNAFVEELRARNIGTSVHFIPLHLHPFYRETFRHSPGDFPIAWDAYQRVISLPIYPRMTEQDVADVIDAVHDVVEGHRRGSNV